MSIRPPQLRSEIYELMNIPNDRKKIDLELAEITSDREIFDGLDPARTGQPVLIGYTREQLAKACWQQQLQSASEETSGEMSVFLDPCKLPALSFEFNEQDFMRVFAENEKSMRVKCSTKKTSEQKEKVGSVSQPPAKFRKTEFPLIQTVRMKHFDRKRLRITRDEEFRTLESVKRDSKKPRIRPESTE